MIIFADYFDGFSPVTWTSFRSKRRSVRGAVETHSKTELAANNADSRHVFGIKPVLTANLAIPWRRDWRGWFREETISISRQISESVAKVVTVVWAGRGEGPWEPPLPQGSPANPPASPSHRSTLPLTALHSTTRVFELKTIGE